MRVAVVGGGMSGLAAALELAMAGVDEVVLYEKEQFLGGRRPPAVCIDGVDLDLGFLLFNPVRDLQITEMLEKLGVEMETCEMSFSLSLDEGKGYEWGTRNGLSSLFAQRTNVVNPSFWGLLREITYFKDDAIKYIQEHADNLDTDQIETLEHFVKSHGYSELFQKSYLTPICFSIWSCPLEEVMSFSAYSVLAFFHNYHLLQLFDQSQLLMVKCRSENYVDKVKAELEHRSCNIKLGCEVKFVLSTEKGCSILASDLSEEFYDSCIISIHALGALKILDKQITNEEARILGAFKYVYSDMYLHSDQVLMPRKQSAWSTWNFVETRQNGACITYWQNLLQKLEPKGKQFLITLSPPSIPKNKILKWTTARAIPSVAAFRASIELEKIQGKRKIWFCGSYQGFGFHEDRPKSGLAAADAILGMELKLLKAPRHMATSVMEAGARLILTRFLQHFISTGSLMLLEGGSIFVFQGTNKRFNTKSILKVHSPSFYWKIATEADIGLADAYINGYFSLFDEENGLLDLLLVLIANRDQRNSSINNQNKRGWWTPLLWTSGVASVRYFFRHISKPNNLSLVGNNISLHYDLSNEFFSLFLDETMQYSSAIFKNGNEDLRVAQMRKISSLIDKAKIESNHQILEFGFGWGGFAIEVVQRTGCRYTGISLSSEQMKYAKKKVEEAGLEDMITLLLCDYRLLQSSQKYDRIISCEMIEHVGHQYIDDFFGSCEKLLAEDGLCVLQFISIPDQRYEEHIRSSDFVKEYIFPGGCLPSLGRITSAMAASSKLCVEHLENIGMHYYQTLMCWRKNLLTNRSKILALGFDEKFIRTWEYYFVYCASGFKSHTLFDYQMVLSRPGNLQLFKNPYEGIPSAYGQPLF